MALEYRYCRYDVAFGTDLCSTQVDGVCAVVLYMPSPHGLLDSKPKSTQEVVAPISFVDRRLDVYCLFE